jgi:tetratricopeptide (TPR) repeat protein
VWSTNRFPGEPGEGVENSYVIELWARSVLRGESVERGSDSRSSEQLLRKGVCILLWTGFVVFIAAMSFDSLWSAATTNLAARAIIQDVTLQPFTADVCVAGGGKRVGQVSRPEAIGLRFLPPPDGSTHRLLGMWYLYQADFANARDELLQGPNSELQMYLLGCAEIGLGNYKRGLAIWPTVSLSREPYEQVGVHLLKVENRPADALPFFEEAKRFSPGSPGVLVYLSAIYWQLGEKQRSLDSVECAAVLAPADWVVLVTLGSVRYNMGDWQGAAQAYRKAIRMKPEGGPGPYGGLAQALMSDGRDEVGAMAALAQGLTVWPDERSLYDEVSRIYYELGRQEAGRYWRQQAESSIRDPLPAEFLSGMVSFYAGEYATAQRVFGEILARHPGHSGALMWNRKLIEGDKS